MNEPRERCDAILDRVDRAVRGALSPADARAYREHLTSCASCRAADADARRVREALRGLRSVECPDPVVARILARTVERDARREAVAGGTTALDRLAAWLSAAMWRPVAATAAAILLVIAVTSTITPDYTIPSDHATDERAAARDARGEPLFCEEDIDALLATMDLGDFSEDEARQAAEEACLAFAILSRAMNRAADAAETQLLESLETPLRKGVGSGMEHLPPPLRRPSPLDQRG